MLTLAQQKQAFQTEFLRHLGALEERRLTGRINGCAANSVVDMPGLESYLDDLLNEVGGDKSPGNLAQLQEIRDRAVNPAKSVFRERVRGVFVEDQDWAEEALIGRNLREPGSASAEISAPSQDCQLSKIFEHVQREKLVGGGWTAKTNRQYQQTVRLFCSLHGDLRVQQISKGHAVSFKEALHKIPKHYCKSSKFAHKSVAEWIEAGRILPSDECGLCVRTINRHLTCLRTIWDWAISNGFCEGNPFKGLSIKDKRDERELRLAFTSSDLEKIFSHPVWTGCKSSARRNEPGLILIKDARYWVPLLALYTGGRKNEICKLVKEDIIVAEGTDCMYFRPNKNGRLKNAASERIVPIHSQLVRLGFLDFVAGRGADCNLFPELRPSTETRSYGDNFDTPWRPIRNYAIRLEERPLKTFHSFRHTFIDGLKQAGVNLELREELAGHAGDLSRINQLYTRSATISAKIDAVERLGFAICDIRI